MGYKLTTEISEENTSAQDSTLNDAETTFINHVLMPILNFASSHWAVISTFFLIVGLISGVAFFDRIGKRHLIYEGPEFIGFVAFSGISTVAFFGIILIFIFLASILFSTAYSKEKTENKEDEKKHESHKFKQVTFTLFTPMLITLAMGLGITENNGFLYSIGLCLIPIILFSLESNFDYLHTTQAKYLSFTLFFTITLVFFVKAGTRTLSIGTYTAIAISFLFWMSLLFIKKTKIKKSKKENFIAIALQPIGFFIYFCLSIILIFLFSKTATEQTDDLWHKILISSLILFSGSVISLTSTLLNIKTNNKPLKETIKERSYALMYITLLLIILILMTFGGFYSYASFTILGFSEYPSNSKWYTIAPEVMNTQNVDATYFYEEKSDTTKVIGYTPTREQMLYGYYLVRTGKTAVFCPQSVSEVKAKDLQSFKHAIAEKCLETRQDALTLTYGNKPAETTVLEENSTP